MSRVLYWVDNSGRADDPMHYSLQSGGVGGEPIPTAEDYLIIDHNSFTYPGQHILFPMEIFTPLITPNLMSQSGVLYQHEVVAEPPITLPSFDLIAGEGFVDPKGIFPPQPVYKVALGLECTVSCPASPTVVTLANHGFSENDAIYFVVNSGQISVEIKTNTTYYVSVIDSDTFSIKDEGGITMNSTGSQTATKINIYKAD